MRKKPFNLEDWAKELAERKAEIIDDFCKAYIAARADFFLQKPERLKRLELREQIMSDGIGRIYSFRIKPGKPKTTH